MTDLLGTWFAASGGGQKGYEVLVPPLQVQEFASMLGRLRDSTSLEAAFLLVPLASTDESSIERAIAEVRASGLQVRVCLAVNAQTFKQVDSRVLAIGDVGVLLDHVDLDTPPSTLLSDGVEAIRFDCELLVRAAESIRAAAAMHAMLGLARDLCLATFGPATGPVAQDAQFDYVADLFVGSRNPPLTAKNAQELRTR